MTRYHVAILQHGGGSISRDLLAALQARLQAKVRTPPEQTEICVWLESPGGDAHAAYKLFLDLRARASQLTAIVPDYAKSAATLLALGMDIVYMAPAAELGPLDVQVGHPDREDEIVSGLDIADSLEFLGTTSVELIIRGGAALRRYTGLPRAEVLKSMAVFAAEFLHPLTAKLDPHLVHRAVNQLKVAEHYAKRMLVRRNLNPTDKVSAADPDELMARLISDYPAHGFVICRDEAARLKLPVRPAEDHPEWAAVGFVNRAACKAKKDLVEVFTQQDIDKLLAQANNQKPRKVERNANAEPKPVAKVPKANGPTKPKPPRNAPAQQRPGQAAATGS